MGMMKKKSEEKPKFRSIVHAVQAGIFVERYVKFLVSQDKIQKAETIPPLSKLWEPIYYLLRKTAIISIPTMNRLRTYDELTYTKIFLSWVILFIHFKLTQRLKAKAFGF